MRLSVLCSAAAFSVLVLGCSNDGDAMSEPQAAQTAQAESLAGPAAEIAALEQSAGDGLVRVIVTVAGEPQQSSENVRRVGAALSAAGAASVAPIAGTSMMVVEATPAQLRAALGTGLVASVQSDTPSPAN